MRVRQVPGDVVAEDVGLRHGLGLMLRHDDKARVELYVTEAVSFAVESDRPAGRRLVDLDGKTAAADDARSPGTGRVAHPARYKALMVIESQPDASRAAQNASKRRCGYFRNT